MNLKIKPNLITELKEFGAFDISACFNCGTCTATCPLVKDSNQFPRQLIRLAQLGQKDKIKGSKELWMCYYCGDCTTACPRGADPAAFMQATRRYVIADLDPTGMSKIFQKHKYISLLIMAVFAIIMGSILQYSNENRVFEDDYLLLGGYYGEIIHWTGIILMGTIGIIILFNIYRLYGSLANNEPLRKREYINEYITLRNKLKLIYTSFNNTVVREVLLQKNFLKEKVNIEGKVEEGNLPSHLKMEDLNADHKGSRWIIHMSIVWGFFGLAFATAFDYLIKDLVLGNPGGWVPIYHPVRIIGIVSGISMMFGTSLSLYYRITKPEGVEYYQSTNFEDYLILILIWLIGLTGFMLTAAVYLPIMPIWGSWILIIHVVVAQELALMLPFTKFTHILYRPLALWMLQYEDEKIEFLENLPDENIQEEREVEGIIPA